MCFSYFVLIISVVRLCFHGRNMCGYMEGGDFVGYTFGFSLLFFVFCKNSVDFGQMDMIQCLRGLRDFKWNV